MLTLFVSASSAFTKTEERVVGVIQRFLLKEPRNATHKTRLATAGCQSTIVMHLSTISLPRALQPCCMILRQTNVLKNTLHVVMLDALYFNYLTPKLSFSVMTSE